MAKRAKFPDNSGKILLYYPLLMLPTTYKDLGDARYTLQGIITAPRHPTDQDMPPTLNQITTKHPTTLMIFQLVAMCYQYTIHQQDLHLVLLNAPQLPGTFQKTEIGTTRTLKPNVEKAHLPSGSTASGLLHLPISCNRHMSTALLDSGASHNFIALPQLKQFAPNSKDWRWAKPLQTKLAVKSGIISSQIAIIFV